MRKILIVISAIVVGILLITPVPLGLVLAVIALVVPFKKWPTTAQLVVRFARMKFCQPLRKLINH